MIAFHCVRETGNPIPVVSKVAGDDEMQFRMWGIPEKGGKDTEIS